MGPPGSAAEVSAPLHWESVPMKGAIPVVLLAAEIHELGP